MSTAEKLSLSLPKEQVRQAKRMARSQNTTFSGLVSRLIEEKRQHEVDFEIDEIINPGVSRLIEEKRQHEEALQAFEEYFGDRGRVDDNEAQQIRRQWQQGRHWTPER